MNTSIFVSSLSYLRNNFVSITSLSSWIDTELLQTINYSDAKSIRSIQKQDFEVLEQIIHLNQDKSIFNYYLSSRSCFCYNGDVNHLLSILVTKHKIDIQVFVYDLVTISALYDRVDILKFILTTNDPAYLIEPISTAILTSCTYGSINVLSYLFNELKIDFSMPQGADPLQYPSVRYILEKYKSAPLTKNFFDDSLPEVNSNINITQECIEMIKLSMLRMIDANRLILIFETKR